MRVGISTVCTEGSMPPAQLAVEVESRGFDTLVLPEHTHIPTARLTPYPSAYGGGSIPDLYKQIFDPFVALSYAAAATTTLRIGTGVCLVAVRDPIETAKQVATLDVLSGGRFVFGIGFGWNADEFANHGVPFRGRRELVREKIAAMRSLWTDDVASLDGAHVQLSPSWAWPKPVQKPHPPVLVGGNGKSSMRHAALWADGWYPTGVADDPALTRSAPAFFRLVEEAGRDVSEVCIGVAPAAVDDADLEALLRNGVAECNVWAVENTRDALLRSLDELMETRTRVLGR
jgi:probable F420-dependent oxidoreductase